jgi:transketolase
VEPFVEKFPRRFINVGVAEQNMVGLATGLAEAGFIPFVYSIVPFAVLRPYEFIRNGPLNHGLPVRIVGVGGGVDYSTNGISHYGLEDVAVLRALPGMTVIAPADGPQASAALAATWNTPGPVYYRLGKDDRLRVPGLDGRFAPGRLEILQEGKDILLASMGPIALEALSAAEMLRGQGFSCTVAVVSTLSPAPTEALAEIMGRHRVSVAVEAHFRNGGLGSLMAETMAERGLGGRLARCGVGRLPEGLSGSPAYLHDRLEISAPHIARAAAAALGAQRS